MSERDIYTIDDSAIEELQLPLSPEAIAELEAAGIEVSEDLRRPVNDSEDA